MKHLILTINLLFLVSFFLRAQSTEELFTLPGLKYVMDINPNEETTKDFSRFYMNSLSVGDIDYHIYELKDGQWIIHYFDGKRVFQTHLPGVAGRLLYDFGLEPGDEMKFFNDQNYILEDKSQVEMEDGLERITLTFHHDEDPDNKLTIIEGIGFTQHALSHFNQTYPVELKCVTSDMGIAYMEEDFSLNECENRSCVNMRGNFLLSGSDNEVTVDHDFAYFDSVSMTFGDGSQFDNLVDSYNYADRGCYKVEVGLFNNCGEAYYYSDFYNNCEFLNWEKSTLSLNNFHFLDANIGFGISTSNKLYKTTDGGENWTDILLPYDNLFLGSMYFQDESTGIIAVPSNGSVEDILVTTDGGENWTEIQFDDLSFGRITMTKDGYVIARNSNGLYRFNIYGGELVKLDIPGYFVNPNFQVTDDNTLIIGQEISTDQEHASYLQISTDNGDSFTTIDLNFDDGVYAVYFLDRYHGFVGMNGDLYETKDGGITWTNTYSFEEDGRVEKISFDDAENGVIEINRRLYITKDGGQSWTIEHCDNQFYINRLQAIDGKYFACINNGIYTRLEEEEHICFVTNTDDISNANALEIIPNPALDQIQIVSDSGSSFEIQIFNSSGTKMIETDLEPSGKIDIAILPKGLYFLVANYNGNYQTLKFVKI